MGSERIQLTLQNPPLVISLNKLPLEEYDFNVELSLFLLMVRFMALHFPMVVFLHDRLVGLDPVVGSLFYPLLQPAS